MPTKKIFLSYSWTNASFAESIDQFFASKIGLPLIRDIRDLKAFESLSTFMHTIQKSDFVILLISDNYLKSRNCMYEVLEVMNTHEFKAKAIPVLTEDWSKTFDDEKLDNYFAYWNQELDKCRQRLVGNVNEKYLEDLRKTERINSGIGEFLRRLTDVKLVTYNDLLLEDFRTVMKKIEFDENNSFNWMSELSKVYNSEEKEIILDQVLFADPKNHYVWFQKGVLAQADNYYKKAILYFNRVLDIFPQDSMAYYNLGNLYAEKLRDGIKAKENYLKCIDINHDYGSAFVNLGNVLRDYFHDYEGAINSFNKAIELNPLHANAYYNLGNTLKEKLLDVEGAIENFKMTLETDPTFAEAHVNLGMIYNHERPDHDKAKLHYTTAVKINPHLQTAQLNLATFLAERGDFETPIANLLNYLLTSGEVDADIFDTLASCYAGKRDYDEAVIFYEKAIAISPNLARPYYNLYILYQDIGDEKKSQFYFQEWSKRKD